MRRSLTLETITPVSSVLETFISQLVDSACVSSFLSLVFGVSFLTCLTLAARDNLKMIVIQKLNIYIFSGKQANIKSLSQKPCLLLVYYNYLFMFGG